MEIPKTIHQIWLDKPSMTQFFIRLIDTWKEKNPEWEHFLWDNENAYAFLEENFENWLPFYEQLTHNVQRFDLLRYLILIKYGGVYVDADYECLDSIDILLENQKIAFGLEPENYAKFHQSNYFIGNCFMASIPQHPFLIEFIDCLKKNITISNVNKKDKYWYVMSTTGPIALNQFYHQYQHKELVGLIDSEIICPLDSNEAKEYYLGGNRRVHLQKLTKAVAIHLFAGTWL